MSRTSATPLRSLAHRLDDEWTVLRHHGDALRRAAGWNVVDTDLSSLDHVLASIGFGGSPAARAAGDHERQERRLRRVVELAGDDPLAARVVLQRLLPGLVAVARRRATSTICTAEQIDELIAAAWIAIATFNPNRRPGSLAAALLADETPDDLARELALTSRAVRYRRAQITDRLRDLALAA